MLSMPTIEAHRRHLHIPTPKPLYYNLALLVGLALSSPASAGRHCTLPFLPFAGGGQIALTSSSAPSMTPFDSEWYASREGLYTQAILAKIFQNISAAGADSLIRIIVSPFIARDGHRLGRYLHPCPTRS